VSTCCEPKAKQPPAGNTSQTGWMRLSEWLVKATRCPKKEGKGRKGKKYLVHLEESIVGRFKKCTGGLISPIRVYPYSDTSRTYAPNTRIYGYIKGRFPSSLATANP
jgi:hypothetical protein